MKKEVTWIPQNRKIEHTALNISESNQKSWVYVHENIIKKMQKTEGAQKLKDQDDNLVLYWKNEQEGVDYKIVIDYDILSQWHRVEETTITQEKTTKQNRRPQNPEEIYFMQLEKDN